VFLIRAALVLHAVGLEIHQIDQDQIDNGTLLFYSSSRSEPLGNEASSSIPTASAVRYYTEIQSCLTAAVFPSILSGNSALLLLSLCNGGSIRIDTQHSLDLRDLFSLIDCTNASYLSVDEHSLLSCMELRPIERRLQCSFVVLSFVEQNRLLC